MRAFAEAYPNLEFVQQVVGQIPWFRNGIFLDKVRDIQTRDILTFPTKHRGLRQPKQGSSVNVLR
jgi:hypothetical protein